VDGEVVKPVVLPTATANFSDDFSDGNFTGWTTDSAGAWEVADGVMQQVVHKSGYAMADDGGVNGDFSFSVDLGYNLDAWNKDDNGNPTGHGWQRYEYFGIMQDGSNSLKCWLSNSGSNGFWYDADGADGTQRFYKVWTGQGMGYDIADLNTMKMERKGDVLTASSDGNILFQATDESPIEAGWIFVGAGSKPIKFDNVVLSSTVPAAQTWTGPQEFSDATFLFNEGEGYQITSTDGKVWGTAEIADDNTEGSYYGWWVDEGAAAGQTSYVAAGGQVNIFGYTMGAQATLEVWCKVNADGVGQWGMPLIHTIFDGSLINPDWGRERDGVFISKDAATGELGVEHNFGGVQAQVPGVVPADEWVHIAWVRDGALFTLYVDGEEVGSAESEKYGDTPLTGMMLTLVNNADHDWMEPEGVAWCTIDQFRVTGAALEPDDFLPPEEEGVVVRVPCDFNGDGNKNIVDVIALLIYMRDNPGDLGADFNGDEKANITDAIAMLLAMRDGTCPDALAQLSSVVEGDYLRVTRLESLNQDDIAYIEEIMSSMNLTEEQEAAFRVALYGRAGAASLPKSSGLAQNSPNPFNPSTTISFTVAEGPAVHVSLKVYDLRGNLVRTLVNEVRDAGTYNVFWDGTNESGRNVSSGVYFYRMQAGDFNQTRKMVLLK